MSVEKIRSYEATAANRALWQTALLPSLVATNAGLCLSYPTPSQLAETPLIVPCRIHASS